MPRDVEAVCLKCLEKDPRRRYATAGQLAEDLQRHLAGQRTTARATPCWLRTWRWAGRRPSAAVLLLLAALSPVGLAAAAYSFDRDMKRTRAQGLRDALFSAETTNLPAIARSLREDLPFVGDELRSTVGDEGAEPGRRLRAALALAPTDESAAGYLRRRALTVTPAELRLICDALTGRREECIPDWAAVFHDPGADSGRRLRAACALAQLAPEADLWAEAGGPVANLLVAESPVLGWTELLDPVKGKLVPRLKDLYADPASPAATRAVAAAHLAEYLADDLPALVGFLREADAQQFHYFFAKLWVGSPAAIPLLEQALCESSSARATEEGKDWFVRSQANLALALLRLGVPKPAFDRLEARPDPRLRCRLIHGMKSCRVDPAALAKGLQETADDSVRSALLLALGDYPPDAVTKPIRAVLTGEINRLYHDHPDPGVHSAAGWLLGRWNSELPRVSLPLDKASARGLRWYTTPEGHTLVVVLSVEGTLTPRHPTVDEAKRAAPGEPSGTGRPPVRVAPFAIATCEVTAEQFGRFVADQIAKRKVSAQHFPGFAPDQLGKGGASPEGSCPVNDVSFVHAALYCNWLSEREGIPPSEWCYDVTVGEQGKEMKVNSASHDLPGYRLPTEAEWEYACRAGTETSRFFGEGADHLSEYGWHYGNSEGRTWPVGRLRPNPLGLFDIYGNVSEWCVRSWDDIPARGEVLRGGAWSQLASEHRSNLRPFAARSYFHHITGFRVAQTLGGGVGVGLRFHDGTRVTGLVR